LAPLLPQYGPSHVLVVIVSNRIILFLDCIHKKNLKWARSHIFQTLCGTFLPVSFPPIFDMGESLKECKGDIFPVGKIVNREITF
jgi:fucose permease